MAYSRDKLIRFCDNVGSAFRPRGAQPQEVFLAKRTEKVDRWQIQILLWNK